MTDAVIYLRVSTEEQATRGGETEGFSIPAQRQACYRKADALGATVIEEFTDAGKSAKSADRPELQRMLAYLKVHPVAHVIVHKVDRLARNRVDDVQINLAIKQAGAGGERDREHRRHAQWSLAPRHHVDHRRVL